MPATNASLAQQNLSQIVAGCQEESQQKRDNEKGYCYELFRRALVLQDDRAWEAIQKQYDKLIIIWLRQNSVKLAANLEDLQQETWSRFWRTLNSKTETITRRFTHVGALLRYLNRCAWATCVDAQRKKRRQQLIEERLQGAASPLLDRQNVVERIEQREEMDRVRQWIETEVTDVQEQLILRLSYEQGLTPKQIAQQHPEQFPDVSIVYRIKERVLKRARYQLN